MARFSREKNESRTRQSAWQRWLPVIAGIVLLGFFGSIFWSSGDYSNAVIIQSYFKKSNLKSDFTSSENMPKVDKKYLEHQYLLAEKYFYNNDFTNAIAAYNFVLENKNNEAYQKENIDFEVAEWNLMLMKLGNGERATTLESLEKISTSAFSEKYKSDALVLKEKLNSFWYGWAN